MLSREERARFLSKVVCEVFSPDLSETDTLALIAVLHLYRFELLEAMVVGDTLVTEVPGADLNDARRVVARLWAGLPTEKKHDVFWYRLWEDRWRAYGTIDQLDAATLSLLQRVCRRLETHPWIASLQADDNRRDLELTDALGREPSLPSLGPMYWSWYSELMRLPLRALVALAARNARRCLPPCVLWAFRRGRPEFIAQWQATLQATEAFVAGRLSTELSIDELQSLFPSCEQLIPKGLGEELLAATHSSVPTPVLDDLTSRGTSAIEFAAQAVQEAVVFLRRRFQIDLEHTVQAVEFAIVEYDYAVLRDFQRLLDLDLGECPDLGRPVDVSENGPLGPLWDAGEDKPDGYEEGLRLLLGGLWPGCHGSTDLPSGPPTT